MRGGRRRGGVGAEAYTGVSLGWGGGLRSRILEVFPLSRKLKNKKSKGGESYNVHLFIRN